MTEEENLILTSPLTEEEVKEAVFGSYANGAPGLDGFSFMFYQNLWNLIKGDLMVMFRHFQTEICYHYNHS